MFREMPAVEYRSGKVKHRAVWDEGTRVTVKGLNLREPSDRRDAWGSGLIFPKISLRKTLWMDKQWANPKGIQTDHLQWKSQQIEK